MEESNIHVIISEMKRERKQYRLRTEPNTNCMGSTELYVFIGMLPLGPVPRSSLMPVDDLYER